MSENLKLWKRLEKTDPKYTKPVKSGGFNYTAITPAYQALKATEAFGPQGIFWGIVPESQQFTQDVIEETTLLHYDAILFYILDGNRGEIPIHASEKLCYRTAKGSLFIDQEARKKVVTRAKSKGFSELGMSADIFLGLFDDYEYKETRIAEADVQRAESNAEEKLNKEIEYKESIEAALKIIKESISMNMLEKTFKQAVFKANARADEKSIIKLTIAKDAKKKELLEVKHDQAV